MWYNERPEPPPYQPFLDRYAVALNVGIVVGESPNRQEFVETAMACEEHLLLDPDTGLRRPGDNRVSTTHATVDESIQIVGAQNRNGKLALSYDQSNQRANRELIRQACGDKLQPLHNEGHHAVGYLAHQNVVFIWASTDPGVITDATRMMQRESRFPALRFVDDGCGHVW